MSSFAPGSDLVEARERLRVSVDDVVAKLRAGVLPTHAEREKVDCKEEAGRRGRGGSLLVGQPHNQEAARQLANEVTCMANTPGGGALLVGVEDRTGQLLGAALDAEWLRHRIYEHVGVAPEMEERRVDGIRLLVLYVAEAREPVEDLNGRIRWRTGGHCVGVDRAEWWLHRQSRVGHDPMAEATQKTEADVTPGAVAVARRYLAAAGSHTMTEMGATTGDLLRSLGVLRPDGRLTAAGALTFCSADRTYITLSVWDVEGGELLSGPREMAGLSLLEQIASVDERLDTLNQVVRVDSGPRFAQNYVRRLPPGAVREAVLNGVVHRDWWMRSEPVDVTWIEADSAIHVVSPGGFTGGITAETVLTQRYARYPALADLFRALRLVEKQGLGVDRMYREMVMLGHRPPLLREEAGPRVRVRLVGGPPVVPVMNLMGSIRPEIRQRDVRVALIAHTLLHQPFTTARELTRVLQREEVEVADALETAADCIVGGSSLITRHKDVWVLTDEAVSVVTDGADPEVLKRRGVLQYIRPDLPGAEAVARRWLAGHDRYTSGDHSLLTGLTYTGARGQLERLERTGLLMRGEGSGRNAHFVAGPALRAETAASDGD